MYRNSRITDEKQAPKGASGLVTLPAGSVRRVRARVRAAGASLRTPCVADTACPGLCLNNGDVLIDFDDPDCAGQQIPIVSAWGLLVITLLLLTVTRIVYMKRRSHAA